MLKEGEVGARVADLCRKCGMSDASYYNLKALVKNPVRDGQIAPCQMLVCAGLSDLATCHRTHLVV